MSPSLNRKITLLGLLSLLLLLTVALIFYVALRELNKLSVIFVEQSKPLYSRLIMDDSATTWRTLDLVQHDIPEGVNNNAQHVKVEEKTIHVQDGDVFYREGFATTEKNVDILLLHGIRFSSKTWQDLGTINNLTAMGYRTIAVDLPGLGNTEKFEVNDRAAFLHDLIEGLKLRKPVIVSPSYSGYFTLPYMLKNWSQMGGFVPVAPVGIDALENYKCHHHGDESHRVNLPETFEGLLEPPFPNLSCIKVPTMVVYGQHDKTRSSALLSLLPWSQPVEIPDGQHPAYLANPPLWHKLLFNFVTKVNEAHK